MCDASPVTWEIASEIPSFLTIDPSSGNGTTIVRVEAKINSSNEPRSGKIKIQSEGDVAYFNVVQDSMVSLCLAEPVDVLNFANGVACGVAVGSSCGSYNIALYEKDMADGMTDEEIRSELMDPNTRLYLPDYPRSTSGEEIKTDYNDVLAWYKDITPNTDYVIVTLAYTVDGEPETICRYPVTTKSTRYQPEVQLSEVSSATGEQGDFWKWSTTMGGFCKSYLVYACADEKVFESFQREDDGVVLAWKIHQCREKVQKGKALEVDFNNTINGRELIFPQLVGNAEMVDLPKLSNDKYLEIAVLAYDDDDLKIAEPSGVVTDVKFDMSTPSDPTSNLDIELNGYQDDVCMDEEISVSTLDINTYSLSFAAASETKDLTLTGNDSWNVTSKPTWCTVSPNSGVGSSTIKVTSTKNTTTEKRTGSIVIEGEKSQKRFTVSVTQEPGGENTIGKDGYGDDTSLDEDVSYNLSLSSSSLDFTNAAGDKSVTISSNDDWNATSSESWCTVSPVSGSGDGTLRITVIKNTQNQKRQAQITVKGRKSGETATLKVLQDAGGETAIGKDGYDDDTSLDEEVSYRLSLSSSSLDFTSAAGYKDVSVSSNDDWNATSSESWCTVSPVSGSGDGTLRITVIKNTQNQKRQAQITVKGRKSGQTATLKVQQDAGGETTIGKDGFSGDINID